MWESNKAQAAALESVMIGSAKHILGCSSRTCNEADMGWIHYWVVEIRQSIKVNGSLCRSGM